MLEKRARALRQVSVHGKRRMEKVEKSVPKEVLIRRRAQGSTPEIEDILVLTSWPVLGPGKSLAVGKVEKRSPENQPKAQT